MPLGEPVSDLQNRLAVELKYAKYSQRLAHVLRGVPFILPLARNLIHRNHLSFALQLLDMWTNDRRYTVGNLKDYLTECLELCGVVPGFPIGNSLEVEDEDRPEVRQMAIPKPTAGQVVDHLSAKGVELSKVPEDVVMVLAKMGTNYGIFCIEQIVMRIVDRQSSFERITFADLIPD